MLTMQDEAAFVREALGAGARGTTHLSPRELEGLRLIARGYTNGEIAGQLFLSIRTVEAHRAHVQDKLGTTTRHELVGYALHHGLLPRPASGSG